MLDEKILSILRNNTDTYVSGEDICKLSNVSRAAVWKHIEKLRTEGYDIEASPHLGYKLINIPDSLIPDEIRWGLDTKIIGREIISYKKVGSTNDIAYELAEKGMQEGTVIISEEQTTGKGRHGRKWLSPPNGGIYLSCILRPGIVPTEIPRITLLGAVAVARAVRKASGLSAMIKWPNDILINSRKVCGILTEMKAEQDRVHFIVVGIGINVNTKARYLPRGASSIKEEMCRSKMEREVSRVELARYILGFIEEDYFMMKKEGFKPIIEEWRRFSAILGSRVRVVLQNRSFEGLAHDIDDAGALLVRRDSGVIEKVSSGDVVMAR